MKWKGTIDLEDRHISQGNSKFNHQASDPTNETGKIQFYAKSDDNLYFRKASGTIVQVGAGAVGPQGGFGYQGFQGNIGFQGLQGFQGNEGPQGFQGWQGIDGTQGYQGIGSGVQGSQGTDGALPGAGSEGGEIGA